MSHFNMQLSKYDYFQVPFLTYFVSFSSSLFLLGCSMSSSSSLACLLLFPCSRSLSLSPGDRSPIFARSHSRTAPPATWQESGMNTCIAIRTPALLYEHRHCYMNTCIAIWTPALLYQGIFNILTRCRPSKGRQCIPDVIIWVHVETYLNVYG